MNEDDFNDDLPDDLDMSDIKLHYDQVIVDDDDDDDDDDEEVETNDADELAVTTNDERVKLNSDSVLLTKNAMLDALDALLGAKNSINSRSEHAPHILSTHSNNAPQQHHNFSNNNNNNMNSSSSVMQDGSDNDNDVQDKTNAKSNDFFVKQNHASSNGVHRDVALDGPEPPVDERLEQESRDIYYDEYEDEQNDAWRARRHAEPGTSSVQTDAVLSCPACFTDVCYAATRLGDLQYTATRVVNCAVRRNVVSKPLRGALPHQQFHPVHCAVCDSELGVRDVDNLYHLFHILPGY